MNEEELKAGERYNFTLLYTGQSINNKFRFESPTGIHYILGLGDMEAVSPVSVPSNGIKNTEPTTKYDPCRKFRKGDIVQVVERHGRNTPLEKIVTDIHDLTFTVLMDEDSDNDVLIETSKGDRFIQFSYLKLVTPVEELEPYRIADHIHGWIVYKDTPGNVVANFNKNHPHAKAAAEAERDRLNAEYRKEQNNG